MLAVMEFAARNVVSEDYTLSNLKIGYSFAAFNNRSG
jgi:hypothetical protein